MTGVRGVIGPQVWPRSVSRSLSVCDHVGEGAFNRLTARLCSTSLTPRLCSASLPSTGLRDAERESKRQQSRGSGVEA